MHRLKNMVIYHGPARSPQDQVSRSGERALAEDYERSHGGHIVEHQWELGLSRRRHRPALVTALQRAKETESLLVIPRFVPSARDPLFLKLLWESEVEFAACDNEYANRLTLPLLASLRLKEFDTASGKIKASLGKAKRRVRNRLSLGNPANLTSEARLLGGARTKALHSTTLNGALIGQLLALRAEGKSLRQIAVIVAGLGHKTKTGKLWSHSLVKRLLARFDVIEQTRAENRAKWGGAEKH